MNIKINIFFIIVLILRALPSYAVSRTLIPSLDIAADLKVIKIFDMHMGTVVNLNNNTAATHTGSLVLNTSHNILKNQLTDVTHLANGTSGKVKVISEPGFVITLWVVQPNSVGSFNSNVFWSDPKCKILRANDATINQSETVCGVGDNVTVTANDSTSYIYVGGKLNFNSFHNAHTGDGGIALANSNNYLGSHLLHVAYN